MSAPGRGSTREEVWQLGSAGNLTAIWTPPAGQPEPLVVVLLNAGVIHHVGAHRIHVKLARHLAARGIGCLRFDFGGVGDSPTARDAQDFRTQAVLDVRTVLDALQARAGADRFALFGICSGAAHAQAAAVADPRIRGIFLIDGFMFGHWRAQLHFLARMRHAYGVAGVARRVWQHLPGRLRRAMAPAGQTADNGPTRTPEDFDADMQALVDRGVRVHTLFTGSVLEVFSHEGQWRDGFPAARWLGAVTCEVEPSIDHTVTLASAQRWLIARVTAWLATVPRDGR